MAQHFWVTIFHTYDLTCGFGGAAIFEGAASWVLMIALPFACLISRFKNYGGRARQYLCRFDMNKQGWHTEFRLMFTCKPSGIKCKTVSSLFEVLLHDAM